LKKLLQKGFQKVGIKSDRTKNITKHVVISFIYKGGSIVSSFLMVPLTINFLDTENYGVWLTLSSFIAWFSFFDIGLGNGLRNKFAEAKAKGDLTLAQGYVSSAYFTIGSICLLLMFVFTGLNFFIDWTRIFNTNVGLQKELGLLMPIVFSFFCLQLVVKLITTIYTADQHHSMQGKINFFTSIGSLLAIWLMIHFGKNSLLTYGIIFSSLPVLILIGLNFYAFSNKYKDFKPKFSLWKKEYLNDIFGLGMKFFIIQISWIVITTTDNFVIAQLFSPKEVVPYNISFKLFSISTMIFSIIAAPYWSTFTEAYVKMDYNWIRKSMKNLNKFVIIFCFFSFFLLLFSDFIYKIWLGNKVIIPFSMNALMCLYSSLIIYLTPFNYFINGIGKIRLQLYQTILMAVLNIPISILFASYFGLGSSGVILGTIVCVLPGVLLSTIQYNKIINMKSSGIWNL
jgi:O-antigen/teichoic acid export membrane protein